MTRPIVPYFSSVTTAFFLISCTATKQKAFDHGTQLYEKGQYAEASIEFRKAIQKDAKFGEAYWKLGLTELKQGKPDIAAGALSQAVTLMPDRVEPKSDLTEVYISAYMADPRKPVGVYRKASQYVDEILSKDPNSFAGLRLKGLLAIADNKPKEAIDYLGRANQIQPDGPAVVTLLVQSLFQDGQAEAGESTASRFLEKTRDYGPLYDILYAHFMQRNQPTDGERVLKLKVANNPKNSFYVIQLARHYWNNGKRDQVAAVLDPLTATPRDFTDAYMDAGNFYTEIREFDNARTQYLAGIRANAKEMLAYQKRLANVLLLAGKRSDAEQVLNEILKDHPDETAARASRGALQLANGKPEDIDRAIADFKYLVEKEPANISFMYQLGRAYELRGAEEAAKGQYLAILRSDRANVPTLDALSHLYLREQRFDDAKRQAEVWLTVEPGNPSARLVRSATLAALGDYDQTRAALTGLIHDYPKLEGPYLQMGLLDVMQKRYDEAEQLFRKYYQPGRGDFRSLKGLVEVYRARGQNDKALATIQQELDKFPRSAEGRQLMAETATRAGKYDLAIEQYQQLRLLRPESPSVPLELGLLYEAKGQRDQAIMQIQAARQMNPKDPVAPAIMGKIREQAGQKQEALADYRESLRLDPENTSVMNNLAFALAETNGDQNEALRVARKALEKSPNNLDFADTLGWIYLKKKEIQSALQVFQGLRQKQPQNATFRIHLAMALLENGDASSAQRELMAARELHPSAAEQAQIQQLLAQL